MTDEPRILTENESYLRRYQQASHVGPKIVTPCTEPGCNRAATNGPVCWEHRQRTSSTTVVTPHLTTDDIEALRAQVAADAAPLFVIAVNWLARQQMARLGVNTDQLVVGMQRIRGELEEDGL